MKLSKHTEALQAYHTFWEANLSADMEIFASFLVDDFSIIGSANGEVFFGKQQAVGFYTDTADQMKGKIELRNRDISVQAIDSNSVVIREQSDVYVLIGTDWTFYGHARISCVLKQTDNGWKAVHQHASLPDHRTEEGQQIAAEKIEKENLELKEAVQRRTVELQAKNRELEIETAVERVRAQSMAMQQTNDIAKINQEIFTQISKLNIDGFTGVAIYLVDEEGMVTVWDLSSPGSMGDVNSFAFKYDPQKTPTLSEFIPIWKAGQPDYFIMDYPKERLLLGVSELEPFYPAMAENFRSAINSGTLQHQWNATAVISHGILSLDMMRPPTDEVRSITLKMAAAFNLAHQRFHDLQNAEAQARESQIQLALERVRARTMAMHHSNELADTASILFQQIKELGFETWSCGFCIWKDASIVESWMGADAGGLLPPLMIPYREEQTHHEIFKAVQRGSVTYDHIWEGKDLEKHYDFLATLPSVKVALDMMKAAGLSLPSKQCYYAGFFKKGYLLLITKEPNPQLKEISQRFAQAFDLTYTRFLDLQKAEAQAREAQVEAALERVRSRTMGMQKSEELKDVIQIVYAQFVLLKIPLEHTGFALDYKNRNDYYIWIADQLGTPSSVSIPYFDCIYYNRFNEAKKNGLAFFTVNLTLEEKNTFYQDLFKHLPGFPEASKEFILQQPALTISTALLDNIALYIENFSGIPYTDEENAILIRLGKVFEQTYTRFLDLQKAEVQTRAAQIELAVERVRAKALAMHSSTQILDLVATLKNEMLGLEIPGVVAATIYLQETDGDIRMWDLSSVMEKEEGFKVAIDVKFKLEETDPGLYIRRVWNNQENYFIEKQEAADMVITIDWLRQYYPEQADEVQQFLDTLEWTYLLHPTIQLAHGKMSVDILDTAPPAEMESIMVKMGAAFDLAYKRFLDLKQSEKQIREAQIELALERVRAKTMSMQHSNELLDSATVLFNQVRSLGVPTWNCSFNIWSEDKKYAVAWNGTKDGFGRPFNTPGDKDVFLRFYEASKQDEEFYVEEMGGEALQLHYHFLETLPGVSETLAELKAAEIALPTFQVFHIAYFAQGYLMFITYEPVPEFWNVFKRFAKVFEQTYTRFLDLQKAEAQTREAQIELSLERIRAKVTAMKVSPDLLDIVVTMRTEFVTLGHEAHYFWHMHWLPDIYEKAMTASDGTRIGNVMTLPRYMHGDISILANWENSQEPTIVYAMDADEAVDYVQKMVTLGDFEQVDPNAPTLDDIRHIGGLTFIMARTTHGEIGYSLPGTVPHPPADGLATLARFAAVFDLAYRRFVDLKSSEKQIREAQIELALERVRARTMAMQHSDELADASFVLDTQVRSLGIQTWGCAFNIYGENESTEWFSSEGGALPMYKTPREDFFLRAYNAGLQGEQLYIEDFAGEACAAHYAYLCTIPVMGDALRGMLAAGGRFPERQIDHATYFKYGYLLFITLEPTPDAHEIFIRFAKVFEQTYTRFLDLQKAEAQTLQAEQDLLEIKAARKKAEEALTELQATQKQLIQSEKMASLGELTAGIAHEIQNPLNFVNNFSEINRELINELVEEVDKGNTDEVKLIAGDIRENSEKINYHGKRADGIVKGMLQHSRTSSGQKEPTDINALCDEYLRLAYHGLRAKDKSFNAGMKTDFDESIPCVSMVPQDIGRVILNLLTNAFYAVNERAKTAGQGFRPMVSISTKMISDKVEIVVSDNGFGIPKSIIDKIFQPFFTTKPTGQGTGLGLSMSYDIITKAHGGELKLKSQEGEGTEFSIVLPIKNS